MLFYAVLLPKERMSNANTQNYFKDFQNLIEIQGLEGQVTAQNKFFEGERQREVLLQRQKNQKQSRLKELQDDLKNLTLFLNEKEKTNAQNQTRIARIKENILSVTDNRQLTNLETEQKALTEIVQNDENSIFQLMLKIDENESEQKDITNFFPGFEKTILEIKNEVIIAHKKVQTEVDGLKMRLENLIEITEPKLIAAYKSSRKRYAEGNVLCFTQQAKCLECRFAIPRQIESQLENGALIDFCPGCARLLTPLSCKY